MSSVRDAWFAGGHRLQSDYGVVRWLQRSEGKTRLPPGRSDVDVKELRSCVAVSDLTRVQRRASERRTTARDADTASTTTATTLWADLSVEELHCSEGLWSPSEASVDEWTGTSST